jgi:hypothetical protein
MHVQAAPDGRGAAVGLVGSLVGRLGTAMFEPAEPGLRAWAAEGDASGASVWDGFVRLVKSCVPISLMLLPQLPRESLRLLLHAKGEGVLRDRFRTWFAAWPGRDTAPAYVKLLLAELPAAVVPPPRPAAAGAGAAAAAAATGAAAAVETPADAVTPAPATGDAAPAGEGAGNDGSSDAAPVGEVAGTDAAVVAGGGGAGGAGDV